MPNCIKCRDGVKLDKGNVLTYSIIERYGSVMSSISDKGTDIDASAIKSALELCQIPPSDWDRHAQKIVLYYNIAGAIKSGQLQKKKKAKISKKLNKKTGGKSNGLKKISK